MKREEDGDATTATMGKEDLQSLRKGGKTMRAEGGRKRRGLKTISLAPYLTPTCIREWEYPLLSRWEKETAGDEPP